MQNPGELAPLIDLTLLRADAVRSELERYCALARELKLHGVCVPGSRLLLAAALLEETDGKVIATVGFPAGGSDPDVKRFETEVAVDNGAHEIEMVANPAWLKEGEDAKILRELLDVVEAADERPVGVIFEPALLNRDQKARLCHLASEAGAKSIGIGTGHYPSTIPLVEEVRLVRELVGDKLGVKAAGKIPDSQTALALIKVGATRLALAEPALLLAASH